MKSKYVDNVSAINVIAGVYNNPNLLDNDKYKFYEELFTEDIHKVLFTSIYNLHMLGNKEINLLTIEDYLNSRPNKLSIYKSFKGADLLLEYREKFKEDTFPYYYDRLTKFCLLREYDKIGIDLKDIYDINNILDQKKKEKQEEWLLNVSLADIAKKIDDKIEDIKIRYAEGGEDNSVSIASGIDEFLESLKQSPGYGYPLYGKYINTITRGARFGKLYLRSAATNVGKTRAMIGDACPIGCNMIWDVSKEMWVSTGAAQPTLFIATEQSLDEIQLSFLACISGVNEEHIATQEFYAGEQERVLKAVQILKNSKIIFEAMPDFSLGDIENAIKRSIREHGVEYCFMDYIHTSIGILAELTKRGGGIKLREDNVLFMMATQLKNIAAQYDIFIMSSTQLNSGYQDAEIYDQNLLRGAKAIADSIDIGMIMLETTQKDREALEPMCKKLGIQMPNIKMSVYKNRANKWKNILVWLNADRGICRFDPVFVTNYNYELEDIVDIKIKVQEEGMF